MTSLNEAIYAALSAALLPDPGYPDGRVSIRQAFTNPAPPVPPMDQDALYYHLAPEESDTLTERKLNSEGDPVLFRFSAWRLNLVIYGPRACSLAWKITDRFFADGAGNPRRILRAHGIYPVPHPLPPALLWEEWGKEHRPRADLTIHLRIAENWIDPQVSEGTTDVPPELRLHVSGWSETHGSDTSPA